jgi:DNA helicase II / ATP-dependent DNA helicase PcrA
MFMTSAIEKVKGPCVILAGAGTGKTYTIVEKVKYILERNLYSPEKIVCLTFSNEAANSLRERILAHVTGENEPVIKTFHSFCADILREHGSKIDIGEEFKILLPDDAKIMLRKNFKVKTGLCHKYINAIGTAKDLGISLEDLGDHVKREIPEEKEKMFEKNLEGFRFQLRTLYLGDKKGKRIRAQELRGKIKSLDNVLGLKKFFNIWKAYEKLKEKRNLQDYSDLNKNALFLLEKHPEIAEKYEYVIVDEFQDTNKLQCDFLKHIAPHKNITVVGDMNQSIYRFRGAYKENISHFKKDFCTSSKSDFFALDKSYRSTNKILRVAHKLISNNYSNAEENFEVTSALGNEGKDIEIIELEDNKEETRKIVEIIESEISSGVSSEEICVMFRTHQQTRLLKNYLDYKKIPFTSVTKKSLLKMTPVKLTVDYLTILNKIRDKDKGGQQAWWDLIYNSEFSKNDLIEITNYIKKNRDHECLSLKIVNSIKEINLSDPGKIKMGLLLGRVKSLISHVGIPISELILRVYEIAGLNSDIYRDGFDRKERLVVLQRFHQLSQEFSELEHASLSGFLRHLEIMGHLGIEVGAPQINNTGIRIMTHHASKGLEYNTIIIAGLAQKKFPIEKINSNPLIPVELAPELKDLKYKDIWEKENAIKSYEQENNLLEERRLCYVAFTRAKEKLYITYAKKYGSLRVGASGFLHEIDYKNNSDVVFSKDHDLKYRFPESGKIGGGAEIPGIHDVLNSKNPGELIKVKNNLGMGLTFSPSSLQTFSECQKKYEYKYLYNMPEPVTLSWESLKLGSFVHLVLEIGVKENYKTEKEFLDLAKVLQMKDEWNFIELSEVVPLVKIFFRRNKDKYNENSLTEQKLSVMVDGLNFYGFSDRIDFRDDGLEIIDYKTGASDVKPSYRNWQLGFYALAAEKLGTPKRLTLEMLKKEKPIEFEIDENGNAVEKNSVRTAFNLDVVRKELVGVAREILSCYDKGFKACSPDKHCAFCEEYVWEN